MRSHRQPSYLPYCVSLIGPVIVLAVSGLLGGSARQFLTPITFVLAVTAAGVLGGWRAGLLSTLLSIAGYHLFFGHEAGSIWSATAQDILRLAVYLILGAMVSLLCDALQRAWRQVNDRAERLRVTLSSIGDAVITTDLVGHVAALNPPAELLTGWSEAEARDRPLAEVFRIVNERTRAIVENPCEKVLRTGAVVGLANHTVLIARDGREIPIDDSAAPIKDQAGLVLGVVLVFRDATRERAATDALQRLASIVEHSGDAIVGKNIDGTITNWNAAAERLFGYAAQEAIGQNIDLIVPTDKREEASAIMQRLQTGEEIDHLDTVRLKKGGTRVPVSLQISPIRDVHGEVVGTSKTAREITARKRTEDAMALLARTSSELHALTDLRGALQRAIRVVVPDFADWCVVCLLDEDGNIGSPAFLHRDTHQMPTLERFLRECPVEWNSATLPIRALRTSQTQHVADVSDALMSRMSRDEQMLHVVRELNPRSVISAPLLVRDRPIGTITFVRSDPKLLYSSRDVTLAEQLAQRVAIAIDNAELLGSIRAIDRQKDEFLAMLAHELRNPLGAITYATALLPTADTNLQTELADVVNRQLKNLSHMIDGLLDVSRISHDKIQLHKEPIEGTAVLRRAAEIYRPVCEERRQQLTVEIQCESIPLFADATRIEQIVTNLITNAIKYTPEGGTISLSATVKNGHGVIKVKDAGIGIPKDVLPRVFQLFAQAEQGLDRSQGGLGIGLTIARKLAEIHGGTVTAFSEGVGKGAEFTVRLPLSDQQTIDRDRSESAATHRGSQLRILVVDDNRDTTDLESLYLKILGHDVQVAYDGPGAIAVAEGFRPQVILMDLGLPGLDGYTVAKTLRSRGLKQTTLIAMSGYGSLEDRERGKAAGFDHHLVKPVDQNALREVLDSIEPVESDF
jgi:PAS domain S-box-containing protein